jgi:hypothetical protein
MTTIGIIFLIVFFILIIITGFIIYKNPKLIPNLIKKLFALFKPKQGIIHEDSQLAAKLPEPRDLSLIEKLPVNNDLLSEEYESEFNKINEIKLNSCNSVINNSSCLSYKPYFIEKTLKFSNKIKKEFKNIYANSLSNKECIRKLANDWDEFKDLIFKICNILNNLANTDYQNRNTKLLKIAKKILLYRNNHGQLNEIYNLIDTKFKNEYSDKRKLYFKYFLLYIDPETETIENIKLEINNSEFLNL